jgi:hypothetical protein
VTPTSAFTASAPQVSAAFSVVRGALRQVGATGTAAGLTARLQAVTKQPIAVMAKTGTLNESGTTGKLKSLAIAMGMTTGEADTAPLRCGLVAVVYFEFGDDWASQSAGTSLPRVHLDFAEAGFADVLARHWTRVGGCAPLPKPAPPRVPTMAGK